MGKIIAASPLPRFCAAAQLTASQKCPCKQAFSLRGKICLGFCLGQNHSGFAASALCASAQLTASQKCLCKHTFLLRGIISAGRIAMQFFTADASTHQRCVCGIDGLAKMPLQASISANFAKRWIYIHIVRGGAPRPHARRAPPPSAIRRGGIIFVRQVTR